jgi:hypothetical protein
MTDGEILFLQRFRREMEWLKANRAQCAARFGWIRPASAPRGGPSVRHRIHCLVSKRDSKLTTDEAVRIKKYSEDPLDCFSALLAMLFEGKLDEKLELPVQIMVALQSVCVRQHSLVWWFGLNGSLRTQMTGSRFIESENELAKQRSMIERCSESGISSATTDSELLFDFGGRLTSRGRAAVICAISDRLGDVEGSDYMMDCIKYSLLKSGFRRTRTYSTEMLCQRNSSAAPCDLMKLNPILWEVFGACRLLCRTTFGDPEEEQEEPTENGEAEGLKEGGLDVTGSARVSSGALRMAHQILRYSWVDPTMREISKFPDIFGSFLTARTRRHTAQGLLPDCVAGTTATKRRRVANGSSLPTTTAAAAVQQQQQQQQQQQPKSVGVTTQQLQEQKRQLDPVLARMRRFPDHAHVCASRAVKSLGRLSVLMRLRNQPWSANKLDSMISRSEEAIATDPRIPALVAWEFPDTGILTLQYSIHKIADFCCYGVVGGNGASDPRMGERSVSPPEFFSVDGTSFVVMDERTAHTLQFAGTGDLLTSVYSRNPTSVCFHSMTPMLAHRFYAGSRTDLYVCMKVLLRWIVRMRSYDEHMLPVSHPLFERHYRSLDSILTAYETDEGLMSSIRRALNPHFHENEDVRSRNTVTMNAVTLHRALVAFILVRKPHYLSMHGWQKDEIRDYLKEPGSAEASHRHLRAFSLLVANDHVPVRRLRYINPMPCDFSAHVAAIGDKIEYPHLCIYELAADPQIPANVRYIALQSLVVEQTLSLRTQHPQAAINPLNNLTRSHRVTAAVATASGAPRNAYNKDRGVAKKHACTTSNVWADSSTRGCDSEATGGVGGGDSGSQGEHQSEPTQPTVSSMYTVTDGGSGEVPDISIYTVSDRSGGKRKIGAAERFDRYIKKVSKTRASDINQADLSRLINDITNMSDIAHSDEEDDDDDDDEDDAVGIANADLVGGVLDDDDADSVRSNCSVDGNLDDPCEEDVFTPPQIRSSVGRKRREASTASPAARKTDTIGNLISIESSVPCSAARSCSLASYRLLYTAFEALEAQFTDLQSATKLPVVSRAAQNSDLRAAIMSSRADFATYSVAGVPTFASWVAYRAEINTLGALIPLPMKWIERVVTDSDNWSFYQRPRTYFNCGGVVDRIDDPTPAKATKTRRRKRALPAPQTPQQVIF